MRTIGFVLGLTLLTLGASPAFASGGTKSRAAAKGGMTVQLLTRDGKSIEGDIMPTTLDLATGGKVRKIALRDVLSIAFGAPASPSEAAHITTDLAVVSANTDRSARDMAVGELTDIGLPVMTPLLDTYKDTDMHQPYPLYRLFARIVPGYADEADRSLDLIRLADGSTLRGKILPTDLPTFALNVNGTTLSVPFAGVRRLAVRRKEVVRTFDLQALYHCVQIEYLDSGVAVGSASKIEESAQGSVRLSWNADGWLSDADGLKVPGPHYNTNLYDGMPYGAILGRIGGGGPRFLVGQHFSKPTPGVGRLYFCVNDSPHWQNNLGSFRVKLRVTDAYDLGDPQ
jgi:hypothetical protein